jgi:hypothetical protein
MILSQNGIIVNQFEQELHVFGPMLTPVNILDTYGTKISYDIP